MATFFCLQLASPGLVMPKPIARLLDGNSHLRYKALHYRTSTAAANRQMIARLFQAGRDVREFGIAAFRCRA